MTRLPLFRSVPSRYLRNLLAEVGGLLVLILLAVEALYLADKTITHLFMDVLSNQLGLLFLLETLALAVPEIMGIGLPLALVIAVYMVLLRRRESGALVILSAAGLAPLVMPVFCLGLGLPAMMATGAVSGFAEPLAAHRLRERLLEGKFEVLRHGQLVPGQFLELSTGTYYRRPLTEDGTDLGADIFVFNQTSTDQEQIITATTVRLLFDTPSGAAVVHLTDPLLVGFSLRDDGTRVLSQRVSTAAMNYGPVLLERSTFGPRDELTRTMTLPELITAWQAGREAAGQAATEQMIGMAVAFLAPFFAGLALVASRGRMVWVALPFALGAVLAGGLTQAVLAGPIVLLGLWGAIWLLSGGTALLALVFAIAMMRGLPASIVPMRREL
jgi:lipopolysaccharide export LptBFGC system permease protein LptF